MSWRHIAPGQYERPCDANEKFFQVLADSTAQYGRARWTLSVVAKINVVDQTQSGTEHLLAAAWLRLRHRTPFIACRREDDRLIYQIPDEDARKEWLAKTFLVERASPEETNPVLKSQEYCLLYYFPANEQIMLRLNHWLADGMGMVNVLDAFLDCLSKTSDPAPEFGDEWQRLPPSIAEAAGYPKEITPAIDEYSTKMLMDFVRGLPSAGLPFTTPSADQPIGAVKRFATQLDEATTTALIKACKQRNISVTAAVHAAVALATHANASSATKGQNYTSLYPVNARPFLPPPYNDHKTWPMGAYLIGPPFSLPPADFMSTAAALHDIYRQPSRKGEGPLFEAYETYCKKLLVAFCQPPPPDLPASSAPYLSSLGRLHGEYLKEEYVGRKVTVGLEHIEPLVDQTISELFCYVWTFRGRFNFSSVYNDAFYAEDFVEEFVGEAIAVLVRELDI